MEKQLTQSIKPWYKSKLVWFNVIVAIGTAAEASLHVIADNFSPEVYFGLILGISGINVVLRFATSTGIQK